VSGRQLSLVHPDEEAKSSASSAETVIIHRRNTARRERPAPATAPDAEVWLLVDPVQDYEESLSILGVYGSLNDAKAALPAHRQRGYDEGGVYGEGYEWRDSEAQLWRGGVMVERLTFNPDAGWAVA